MKNGPLELFFFSNLNFYWFFWISYHASQSHLSPHPFSSTLYPCHLPPPGWKKNRIYKKKGKKIRKKNLIKCTVTQWVTQCHSEHPLVHTSFPANLHCKESGLCHTIDTGPSLGISLLDNLLLFCVMEILQLWIWRTSPFMCQGGCWDGPTHSSGSGCEWLLGGWACCLSLVLHSRVSSPEPPRVVYCVYVVSNRGQGWFSCSQGLRTGSLAPLPAGRALLFWPGKVQGLLSWILQWGAGPALPLSWPRGLLSHLLPAVRAKQSHLSPARTLNDRQ